MSMESHHLPAEVLSAHLDRTLDESEALSIEAHIAACPACAQTLASLRAGASAVASIPAIEMTADDHRAIRQAVMDAAGRRTPRMAGIWALAGAAVLVIGGIALTRPGDAPPAVDSSGEAGSQVFMLSFKSEAEVRDKIGSQPEVREGTQRYRVSDIGEMQQAAVEQLLPASAMLKQSETEAKTFADSDATGSMQASTEFSYQTGKRCLREVLKSQPYPMMPLMARQATFKSRDAWLLVYAWTPSTEDDAPLDRIQVWIFAPADCATRSGRELTNAALHYSFFSST